MTLESSLSGLAQLLDRELATTRTGDIMYSCRPVAAYLQQAIVGLAAPNRLPPTCLGSNPGSQQLGVGEKD